MDFPDPGVLTGLEQMRRPISNVGADIHDIERALSLAGPLRDLAVQGVLPVDLRVVVSISTGMAIDQPTHPPHQTATE
jgi:hypothetical protein